jgi:DGQHR domain-containing protein
MPEFDALQITQPSGRKVLAFAATAEEVLKIADIARIGRNDDAELLGYQRPEVASHIAEIRRYLDGPDATLPNAIVLAFDERVTFEEQGEPRLGQPGTLRVPTPAEGEQRPGFVVDGQQRLAALAGCNTPNFPVFVTAVTAPDVAEQRRLFMLVNKTKPLPKELIFELLSGVDGHVPAAWVREREASRLIQLLNLTPGSFLFRRIRTATCPVGLLKDTAVKKLLINSLTEGALGTLVREVPDATDLEAEMARVVSTFWEGVARVFPDAWELPPHRSRLTHGAGVVSMGFVMDDLFICTLGAEGWTADSIQEALEPLREECAWTSGRWHLADGTALEWNDFQVLDRHIRRLYTHLRWILQRSRRVNPNGQRHDTIVEVR